MIKVHVLRLNARHHRPEHSIPEFRLLPVIPTLSVSLAMMQVMILNDQLTTNKPQHKRRQPRRDGIHAQPGMPHNLREQDKRLADPPVVEGHRQPEAEFNGKICQQRHDKHFHHLLLDVRETRQDRDGMLGGVVRFVVFPQRADFVAGAVVGVEPEVEDDAVEEEFEG